LKAFHLKIKGKIEEQKLMENCKKFPEAKRNKKQKQTQSKNFKQSFLIN